MDDRAALEMRYARNGIGGSNPPPSAKAFSGRWYTEEDDEDQSISSAPDFYGYLERHLLFSRPCGDEPGAALVIRL